MPYVVNPDIVPTTNGDAVISANTTLSTTNVLCTGTAGTKTLSATGTFNPGDMLFIHNTIGGNYGQNDINFVVSYTPGTVTLLWPLANTYTTNQGQVVVFYSCRSLTINAGFTLTGPSWQGWGNYYGGITAIAVRGTLYIPATGKLNFAGKQAISGTPAGNNSPGGGFLGGAGSNGGGALSGESHAAQVITNTTRNAESGGGGKGGTGDGQAGAAIPSFDTTLTSFFPFPGAGGGTNSNSGHGRSGGNGAGIAIIIAGRVHLGGTDGIYGHGGDGIDNQDAGPGAGANVRIITRELKMDTTDCINLSGGTRTSGASDGDHGGGGGNYQAAGGSTSSANDGFLAVQGCRIIGTTNCSQQNIQTGFSYCGRVGRMD